MPRSLHTLRSALILRRQHGLETYALFVDLVKAFDTVNHSLLIKVLSKYGIPPTMCRTIAKLYKNGVVQLKTGKSMCEIDYKTGMQQGNNMVPILFLYIMQAVIESLHMKLTCDKVDFHCFPNQKSSTCQYRRFTLQPKPNTTKGNALWPAIHGWWYLPLLNPNWNERSNANFDFRCT